LRPCGDTWTGHRTAAPGGPNGLYNLSKLSVWWLRLGVQIERIKPGQPNLRIWFTAEDGTMRPGNKGLAFKLAVLPEVIEVLQAAEAKARRLGLLHEV
jgi:hypothetical protein